MLNVNLKIASEHVFDTSIQAYVLPYVEPTHCVVVMITVYMPIRINTKVGTRETPRRTRV